MQAFETAGLGIQKQKKCSFAWNINWYTNDDSRVKDAQVFCFTWKFVCLCAVLSDVRANVEIIFATNGKW